MNIHLGSTTRRMFCWLQAFAIMGLLSFSTTLYAQSVRENFIFQDPPKPIPYIEFKNDDGQTLTLADFQGRIVLLNLWATWCAPCRREMPTLDHLQETLGGAEFEVVALSLDKTDKKMVKDFLSEIGTSHLAYYQDRTFKTARKLRAIGLPTTMLIDREGKEIGRLLGPAEWDSPEAVALIEKYLGPGGDASKESERLKPRSIRARTDGTNTGSSHSPIKVTLLNLSDFP